MDECKERKQADRYQEDSEGLGCIGDGKVSIGYVDEVNGAGAVEIPSFVPTRHELIQLVKYWATQEIDCQFFWFACATIGSSEMRIEPFAARRIVRIAKLLGEDEVEKAVKQAHDEFWKDHDPETRRIFYKGTREEIEAFRR